MFDELATAATHDFLTILQVEIFLAKKSGKTYEKIILDYELSGNAALVTCLVRTAQFKIWYPGYEGGADVYLSKIDQQYFIDYVTEAADFSNCIPAIIAANLAFNLKKQRIKKAALLLTQIGCPKLIEHLDDLKTPCQSWIYHFVLQLNLRCVNPQPLEFVRRFSCDQISIQNFFTDNWLLLNRNPKLIFNMDETMVDTNRKLKVIAPKGVIPITIENQKFPHITGVVTICADGFNLDPFIILPNKKTRRNIENFIDSTFVVSTASGWMNKDCFVIYALYFCSFLSHYRLKLPHELRDEPVLLIVDGHSSRENYLANYIFNLFNVDLLVLPSHCTHILQPFDVSVAGPLKSYLKIELSKIDFNIEWDGIQQIDFQSVSKKTTQQIREQLVFAFKKALHLACTFENIESGFSKTGIFPLDVQRPIQNNLTLPTLPGQLRTQNLISSKWINSTEMLNTLFSKEYGRIKEDDDCFEIEKIIQAVKTDDFNCILLSDFPTFLLEDEKGNYFIKEF